MTVNSVADGGLTVGMFVYSSVKGLPTATTINAQLTGIGGAPCPDPTCNGGIGTYQLSAYPQTSYPAQGFQGNGQMRVTLNSTAGLTSGDTLFLKGVTGSGQLPQRVNGLRWIKVVSNTQVDLFQSDYDGGYARGGTGGGDRTSLTPVGSKVMMSGYVLQAYWANPYGFPSNQHWFEYNTVASTNSGTHQVCFTKPLKNTYLASWPQFNTGSPFEIDAAGPATLYHLDDSWELTHVYQDFALDNISFQTTANGRNITYQNVKFVGAACAIPSQNETHTWISVDGTDCSIETDKLVGTWKIRNATIRSVGIQSSSMDLIDIDNLTVVKKWEGSAKRQIIKNMIVNGSGLKAGDPIYKVGTSAYGVSDETSCTNCSFRLSTASVTRASDTQPVAYWRMSGGVITIPNTLSANAGIFETQTRFLVPGHYVFWAGNQVGRAFKVLSVTQDLANTYVKTNEAGGFPTGAWTSPIALAVFPHPAPMFTVSGARELDPMVAFNGCPPKTPIWSCQNFTYTGGPSGVTSGFGPTLWGELDAFTVTNNAPYTGTGTLSWNLTRFNNWQVLKTDLTQVSYGTFPNGQFTINTKLPSSCGSCTRTLTPSGATNTQAGDLLSAPPIGALFGGVGGGPSFSANTPSGSPQVTITLRTNQKSPVKGVLFRWGSGEGNKKCPPAKPRTDKQKSPSKDLDVYASAPSRLPTKPFGPAAPNRQQVGVHTMPAGHLDDARRGFRLSSMIQDFSVVDHGRRRSGPDRTETLLTFAHLPANQSANYRRQSYRREGGPQRMVTEIQWEDWLLSVRHDQGRPLRRLPSGSFTQRLSGDGCAKIDEAGNGHRRHRRHRRRRSPLELPKL